MNYNCGLVIHHTSHRHRGRWGRSWLLLIGCAALLFPLPHSSAQEIDGWNAPLLLPANASPMTLLECDGVGSGGDKILLRGIRFTVKENFGAIELRLNSRNPGNYTVELELRRSSGFSATPELVTTVQTYLPGTLRKHPYPAVRIQLPEINVNAPTDFTLRLIRRSGPSQVFFEIFGNNYFGCVGVEETENNRNRFAPYRGQPAGFRVFQPIPPKPSDEVPVG